MKKTVKGCWQFFWFTYRQSDGDKLREVLLGTGRSRQKRLHEANARSQRFRQAVWRWSEFRLVVLEAWVSANAVPLAALPSSSWKWRLHPAHRLQRQQDPLVRLSWRGSLAPSDSWTNPAGALAIGTQSIAMPMNRALVDAISNALVLQAMRQRIVAIS